MTRGSFVCHGVTLSCVDLGTGPPCLVLHGFTGSAAAMAPITGSLAGHRRVIVPDLVGHGCSSAPDDLGSYSLDAVARQLAALLEALELPQVDVVGYSMGGRVALHFATSWPKCVRSLVVISGTAGLESAGERSERVRADEALASDIEAHGVEAFVDRWEKLPLFASQEELPAAVKERIRADRVRSSATGLANSLRGSGTGQMAPLWDKLGGLNMPALVLAGSLDLRYVDLGRRISEAMPNARFQVVEGAGHAVHIEAPKACAAQVEAFLSSP